MFAAINALRMVSDYVPAAIAAIAHRDNFMHINVFHALCGLRLVYEVCRIRSMGIGLGGCGGSADLRQDSAYSLR